ncbi:MAG: LysM peptidoglycan-binding domain-containing protein [Anaerolineae bacterium]|nr:LysM peptidoglycan-binding domain-containing protein [Anaerolineae bacterium]
MPRKLVSLGLLVLLLFGLTLMPIASAQEGPVIHVVRPGETLYLIAARYNVTVRAIMQANGLRNPNVIYVGQELVIPANAEAPASAPTTPVGERVHIVARGQTLFSIALRYNVTVGELMRANNLRNPNLIYPGQRLVIPSVAAPTALPPEAAPAMPTPTLAVSTPTPTPGMALPTTPRPQPEAVTQVTAPIAVPPPGPCACDEVISILSPAPNQTVVSPVVVTGLASAFEQQITVRILDESGAEVGLGVGFIDADMGQRGPFTATVPFAVPLNTQFGRIQVYSVSPRDGAVEHLSSVTIRLQGLDLEPMLDLLREAIEAKNYEELRSFMPPDSFSIGFYRGEGQVLSPDAAIQSLRENYLGPGRVKVDLSVNGRELLKDRVVLPADVRWVAYSTGWGKDGKDDAFLLIMERNGRAFWGGLLYVPTRLVDYR